MCVVVVSPARAHRPSFSTLKACAEDNPHGIGMSWVESSTKKVLFEKGINLDQAWDWSHDIGGPIIWHFRIASVGAVDARLCHPFPISPTAPLGLTGKTRTGVLFHNGTWYDWENACLEAALRHKVDMPGGIWSDTRAAAMVVALDGAGAIKKRRMTGKFALLTPKGYQLYGDWYKHNGVYFSNLYWKQRSSSRWTLADQLKAQDEEEYL